MRVPSVCCNTAAKGLAECGMSPQAYDPQLVALVREDMGSLVPETWLAEVDHWGVGGR